jgi:hypothetical protein
MKKNKNWLVYGILIFIGLTIICVFAFTKPNISPNPVVTKSDTKEQSNGTAEGKNDNISNIDKNQEIIKFAIDGIKAYREVNYQDQNYEGFNSPEIFAIGFRNGEIVGKAEERLKEVKYKKIIRKISNVKTVKVENVDDVSYVELAVTETGSELGTSIIKTYKSTVTLKKNGDLWLIYNIQIEE